VLAAAYDSAGRTEQMNPAHGIASFKSLFQLEELPWVFDENLSAARRQLIARSVSPQDTNRYKTVKT
jgi:hypothetical protein